MKLVKKRLVGLLLTKVSQNVVKLTFHTRGTTRHQRGQHGAKGCFKKETLSIVFWSWWWWGGGPGGSGGWVTSLSSSSSLRSTSWVAVSRAPLVFGFGGANKSWNLTMTLTTTTTKLVQKCCSDVSPMTQKIFSNSKLWEWSRGGSLLCLKQPPNW